MKINIHAGHGKYQKGNSCGAIGLLNESNENRNVKNAVMELLIKEGHDIKDCTAEIGTQSGILSQIVSKCNSRPCDLDISIHFNAGRRDLVGDGKNGGVEVYIYQTNSPAKEYALSICNSIAKLGFTNRGVKSMTSLTYLKKCKNPCILIECCFVDDADDYKLYKTTTMAKAIVDGIKNVKAPKVEVSITGDKLVRTKEEMNIRSGAGTNYPIVAKCPKGTYTIKSFSGTWGLLKSNLGWINCSTKYVDYV